jgi:hypothetical protein
MRRASDNLEFGVGSHPLHRGSIELDDDVVATADDEKRRRLDERQSVSAAPPERDP